MRELSPPTGGMRYVQGVDCDFYIATMDSIPHVIELVSSYDTPIAIDTEVQVKPGGDFTDPYTSRVRLLQLGFLDREPIIIDIQLVDQHAVTALMQALAGRELVAHNATYDYKQIKVSLGVSLLRMLDSKVAMQTLALASGYKAWSVRGFTYHSLCRDLLGVRVDKTLQASDWGAPILTDAQYEYAALDVGAPRGRKCKSLLLQAYGIMQREAARLGMTQVWDLRQSLVPIVGDMELNGLLFDSQLLKDLEAPVHALVKESTLTLCKMLGLELIPTMDILPDGRFGTTSVPSPAASKLLNYKAGLLSHVNKAISAEGVVLSDLKEDSLKPYTHIPLLAALGQYTKHHKLLGDVRKYQRVNNPITGRVHFQTHIVGTSTGRMAGSSHEGAENKLSVQQMSGDKITLPDGRKTSLRGCVMAPPGYVLLDLDFSGQELRIAAALSRDQAMLDTFFLERDNPWLIRPDTGERFINPMTDLHLVATMAMKPYEYLKDLPLWEVLEASKVEDSEGKSPRSIGKGFNFSLIYGSSAVSLSEKIGCSQKEAELYMKDYFKNFRGLKAWLDQQSKLAVAHRWLPLPMGAQLFVNEANAKGSGDRGAISRRAGNMPIQGTGAIMMALAIKYQRERLGPLIEHLAFIYDGMLARIPLPKGEEAMDGEGNWNPHVLEVQRQAKQCFLDAEADILSPYIGQPFPCAADSKLSLYWSH